MSWLTTSGTSLSGQGENAELHPPSLLMHDVERAYCLASIHFTPTPPFTSCHWLKVAAQYDFHVGQGWLRGRMEHGVAAVAVKTDMKTRPTGCQPLIWGGVRWGKCGANWVTALPIKELPLAALSLPCELHTVSTVLLRSLISYLNSF